MAVVSFFVSFSVWIITGDFLFSSSCLKCSCEQIAPDSLEEENILTSNPEPTWEGSFQQFLIDSGTSEFYDDLFDIDWTYDVFYRVFNRNGEFPVLEDVNQTVKVSQPTKLPLFLDLDTLSIAFDCPDDANGEPELVNAFRLRGLDEIGNVRTVEILEDQLNNTQLEIKPND